MTTFQFSAPGAPGNPSGPGRDRPLPNPFAHLRLRDSALAREIAAILLAPLADPYIDEDGSDTLVALEIAAQCLLLRTTEQKLRMRFGVEDARLCEQDRDALHAWRRREWAESIRVALHDLPVRPREAELETLATLYGSSAECLGHFEIIAVALDHIRLEDDGPLPEIE